MVTIFYLNKTVSLLLIDAIYIHESGGKALLEYLLRSLSQAEVPFFLLADERLEISSYSNIPENKWVKLLSTESNRKHFYEENSVSFGTIFCFANVPPPVTIKRQRVFVLFQNTLILSTPDEKNGYGAKQKFLFVLRRKYIQYRNKPQYHWLVQTQAMKARLSKRLFIQDRMIDVIPFFEFAEPALAGNDIRRPNSFLYAADGVPHKNHQRLLDAWVYLFEHYHLNPELHLTIPDRFTDLLSRVDSLQAKGLAIRNHGRLGKQALADLYSQSEYLVFPSLSESFGLPLLEAVQAGVKVLAADLPYVYDVIIPSGVFDAMNAEAIAALVAKTMQEDNVKESTILVRNEMERLIQVLRG